MDVDAQSNKANKKKKDQKEIKGVASVPTGEGVFLAADRRAWLYVGRASISTTSESLKTFLTQKLKTDVILVEELKTTNEVEKLSKSFKIGFNFDLLETVENPEFWPQNILVRRYRFFRGGRK